MSRWKWGTVLLVLLLALPYAALLAAGMWWIYQQGWLMGYLLASVVLTLAAYGVVCFLNRGQPWKRLSHVDSGETWSPAAAAAMEDVRGLAQRVAEHPPPLGDGAAWQQLLVELLTTVARRFHPHDPRATLNVTLVDVLLVTELVAADMRAQALRVVPLSHLVRLKDWVGGYRLASGAGEVMQTLTDVRNFGMLLLAPPRGLLQLLVSGLLRRGSSQLALTGKRTMIAYAVQRAGFYAIELYSGHLPAYQAERARLLAEASGGPDEAPAASPGRAQAQPLHLLVLGATKAGKSSLINALFGTPLAPTDVIPRTTGIDAYEFRQPGMGRAIILDSAGYGGADAQAEPQVTALLEQVDLVLLVTSASSAARQPDRRMLDQLRQRLGDASERVMPPVIAVVSRIDVLRPVHQWQPPYNVTHPSGPKERAIAELLQVVAEDLQLPPQHVVPVCLLPERLYNVHEALLPVILSVLPSARRSQVLRTLPVLRRAGGLRQLWQQAVELGQVAIGFGREQLAAALQAAPHQPAGDDTADDQPLADAERQGTVPN